MSLDQELLLEVASELGVSEAFIEKDWYAVQALKAISEAELTIHGVTTIFSGGTSLSKGYGLIKRFSEDLDFRCQYTESNLTGSSIKRLHSAYRKNIIERIGTIAELGYDESRLKRGGNFFKFPLSYPASTAQHTSLRPNLEIEFSFTQPRLSPICKPVSSFISDYLGQEPETDILCLSPIETGADKLSALTWRILKRDRAQKDDDPTIIRHLHDLCALSKLLLNNVECFMETAHQSFSVDQNTHHRKTDTSFYQSVSEALEQLNSDPLYREEYNQFAYAMSYAKDDQQILFDQALNSLERVANLFE